MADPATSSAYPAVSAPEAAYHLAADGSVPWVDEPVSDRNIYLHTPPPTAPAGSKPCTKDQLTGTMGSWITPNSGGETPRGFDAHISHLYGYVGIHNTANTWCTLQGEAPTTMVSGTTQVPMEYFHGINDRARAEVTSVPPDGHASLRLDWDGPFCAELTGQLWLDIELPNAGGTVRAALTATERPECNTEVVKPTVKGALSASGFGEAVDLTPIGPSPLQQLTAAITGPQRARPGERIDLRVTLTNPTGGPITLRPCPAYRLALNSVRDELGEPVSDDRYYLLNCRPIEAVAEHGSLTYQIAAVVPDSLVRGRRTRVTWELHPRVQTTGDPVHAELGLEII